MLVLICFSVRLPISPFFLTEAPPLSFPYFPALPSPSTEHGAFQTHLRCRRLWKPKSKTKKSNNHCGLFWYFFSDKSHFLIESEQHFKPHKGHYNSIVNWSHYFVVFLLFFWDANIVVIFVQRLPEFLRSVPPLVTVCRHKAFPWPDLTWLGQRVASGSPVGWFSRTS